MYDYSCPYLFVLTPLIFLPQSDYFLFLFFFFFFNDPATTEIYTLSLHDALPICRRGSRRQARRCDHALGSARVPRAPARRSEEHTSELQSRVDLVCRLLLEKKKKKERKSA